MKTLIKANTYFASRALYNNEVVQPQKLFDKTWKIVYKEYYDSDLNHQNWSRWKEHYHGKIKTEDDAKVAIDSMVASLNDPYTRFMPKKILKI